MKADIHIPVHQQVLMLELGKFHEHPEHKELECTALRIKQTT